MPTNSLLPFAVVGLVLLPLFPVGPTGLAEKPATTESPIENVAQVDPAPSPTQGKFKTESIRGRVVWFHEALKRRFGISKAPSTDQEQLLALETEAGQILPILEDVRGRSFRVDKRLRGKPAELLVRRYEKHPMLQVIRIYQFEKEKKFEVDYWCDVCAIVMFEKGFCACCQDDNRIRLRLVKDGVTQERD